MILHIPPGAPKLEVESRYQGDQHVKGGTTLILQANVSGEPAPTLRWYHGDTQLTADASTSLEATPTFTRIKVSNVTKANSGRYKVTAENKVGSDSAEFSVLVKGKGFIYIYNKPYSGPIFPILPYIILLAPFFPIFSSFCPICPIFSIILSYQ